MYTLHIETQTLEAMGTVDLRYQEIFSEKHGIHC